MSTNRTRGVEPWESVKHLKNMFPLSFDIIDRSLFKSDNALIDCSHRINNNNKKVPQRVPRKVPQRDRRTLVKPNSEGSHIGMGAIFPSLSRHVPPPAAYFDIRPQQIDGV